MLSCRGFWLGFLSAAFLSSQCWGGRRPARLCRAQTRCLSNSCRRGCPAREKTIPPWVFFASAPQQHGLSIALLLLPPPGSSQGAWGEGDAAQSQTFHLSWELQCLGLAASRVTVPRWHQPPAASCQGSSARSISNLCEGACVAGEQ